MHFTQCVIALLRSHLTVNTIIHTSLESLNKTCVLAEAYDVTTLMNEIFLTVPRNCY